MTKLKWEKKSDTWEIAWLDGIDASCLEVKASVEPHRGFRWGVWDDGGFEPTMEEAKLACEAAAQRRLLAALTQVVAALTQVGLPYLPPQYTIEKILDEDARVFEIMGQACEKK
jgi:hypothetical protein